MIKLFIFRDHKAGCFLIVKRTKAQEICPPFFKPHEFAHHVHDVDMGKDLLYGLLGNQGIAMYVELVDEHLVHESPSLLAFAAMPGR